MKVKNLIALLSTFDPEAEFIIGAPSGDVFEPETDDFSVDPDTGAVCYEIYDPC